MKRDKLIEAQTVFGMYPEGGLVDDCVLAAAKPVIEGIAPGAGLKATIDALRPVVLDAIARRQHLDNMEIMRHTKRGCYGPARSAIRAIREEIDRRGPVEGSSLWKEAIKRMVAQRDRFAFRFGDEDGPDASLSLHGSKGAADCKGVVCIVIDDDGEEYKVKMSTVETYLKTSR